MNRDEVMDEEANVFAAFLLMPSPHFDKAMKGVDLLDDVALEKVAKLFRVNVPAVLYRESLRRNKLKSKAATREKLDQ